MFVREIRQREIRIFEKRGKLLLYKRVKHNFIKEKQRYELILNFGRFHQEYVLHGA